MLKKSLSTILTIIVCFAAGGPLLLATSSVQVRPTQPSTQGASGVRSFEIQVPSAVKPVAFTKTAFNPQNPSLMVGAAAAAADNNFAVTKVQRSATGTGLTALPLTPEKASVNGIPGQNNDLFGQEITNLALAGDVPVVTVGGVNSTKVYAITDPVNGASVVSTAATLKDAASAEVTKAVAGISGSGLKIGTDIVVAAAVPANGQPFNAEVPAADFRGIALMKVTPTGLTALDATNFANNAGAKAVQMSTKAIKDSVGGQHVAFFGDPLVGGGNAFDHITFDKISDMYVAPHLQRLYVALDGAKRDDRALEGGVLGLLMGRLNPDGANPTSLMLKPIIAEVKKAGLYDGTVADSANVNDRMIGFYFDGVTVKGAHPVVGGPLAGTALRGGNEATEVSIKKVRTMKTSTDKDYLIVASNITTGGADSVVLPGGMVVAVNPTQVSGVFALPLVNDQAGAAAVDADKKGTIAQVNAATGLPTFDTPAAALDELQKADDKPAKITLSSEPGGIAASAIEDMFVVGDSVFLCVAQGQAFRSGMFQSTALFNEDGSIRAWTPLTRVMGSFEASFGGGLDADSGDFYFLGQTGAHNNTPKATHWGKSQPDMHKDAAGNPSSLSDILAKNFPAESGGVHQIFTFDEQTPGFETHEFSMMVAVGRDKVALIQTGEKGIKGFQPTKKFVDTDKDPNQNVVVLGGADLAGIAPLAVAEVLRDNMTDNKGYLYVGGYKGAARLEAVGGNGWASKRAGVVGQGLQKVTDIANFTFKKQGAAITKVRKIAADGAQKQLYLLTDKIVRVADQGLAMVADTPLPDGAFGSDLVFVQNNVAVVATNRGLYGVDNNAGAGVVFTKVPQFDQPVVQLAYMSETKGNTSEKGVLYVLTGNMAKEEGKVYRFVVDATQGVAANRVKPLDKDAANNPVVYKDLKDFRGNMVVDGSVIFTELSKHLGNPVSVRVGAVGEPSADGSGMNDIADELDIAADNIMAGSMIRDSASGAWYIPGDFGVRVNE